MESELSLNGLWDVSLLKNHHCTQNLRQNGSLSSSGELLSVIVSPGL
jgi:hypothetical protein